MTGHDEGGHDDGRQRKQAKAAVALALAAGRTVREASDAGNVTERTTYRWLRQASFGRTVAAYRSQMIRAATGRLADTMAEAADVLRELLADETPSVRLRAADLLLSHGVRLDEAADLRGRVEELEERVNAREVVT